MALSAGDRLGPYEIVEPLGAGGMGEVYRATDTTLKRAVALKVLKESVAGDAERLARFQREAEVLASLNDPNIAALYELERSRDTTALVMELVDGPTLASRIAEGPIPLDEALPIARQIASALEAAHARGIIHRDLKPANVKVRGDGTVKVLDFGLAKALEPMGSSPDESQSPTLTSPAMSRAGVILGTAAYMSPEQARGKPVDERADVWAFGVVLYEMLTGGRAFAGEDMTDTLAAVVRGEPSWDALPAGLSPVLRSFLHRCLQKDPRQRLHDIADMRLALEGAFDGPSEGPEGAKVPPSSGRLALLASAVALAALVAGVLIGRAGLRGPAVSERPLTRLTLDLEPGYRLSTGDERETVRSARQRPLGRTFALSPDGRLLVYAASDGVTTRLFRRPMDQAAATPMPGTDGAHSPFFSPNGESVAFFVGEEIKRVSVRTGEVRALAVSGPRPEMWGTWLWTLGSWTDRDTIVLGSTGGVYELPENGGRLTRLGGASWVTCPQLLPGGQALLFNQFNGLTPSDWDIEVESLESGQRHVVVDGGSDPRYVPSGHILFARRGTLMAVPFDVTRLEATGPPIVVLEDVMHAERGDWTALNTGAAQFSVSRSGTLAYAPGGVFPVPLYQLVWVDRTGAYEPLPLPPGAANPRFSPDGRRLLYSQGWEGDMQIWVYDIALETPTRLTTTGTNFFPLWSPDGQRALFTKSQEGPPQIFSVPVDGNGEPELLFPGHAPRLPSSCSPEGVLAFVHDDDVWTAPLNGEGDPAPFLETPFEEAWPAFSPDGRWLAYGSNETGRAEVYVRSFPDGAPVHRISTAGGRAPLWAPDGRQLFYRTLGEDSVSPREVMVVDVATDDTFTRSQPRVLFDARAFDTSSPVRGYDISPDGRRFAMYTLPPEADPEPVRSLHIVLNWLEDLEQRVPVE